MRVRVKMDIFYFKKWSLVLDVKIVFMTVVKMLANLNLKS
jgi:lipopolysaccharide/colanic/teichoic acid biosynthesis glycosyltransferase